MRFLVWPRGRGVGGNFCLGDPLKRFPGSLVVLIPPFPFPCPGVKKGEALVAIMLDVIVHVVGGQ